MTTVLHSPEQRVVLHEVSWETYESLLADLENSSAPRLTYDRGTLEIMSPLPEHERVASALALIVELVASEWSVEVDSLGSTTFRRSEREQGFEPDACFYIQNVEQVRTKERIDLSVDPPPDLAIEIDLTHQSLNKLSLFAQFGVPEVWRYEGQVVRIYTLHEGAYAEAVRSQVLPHLTATVLSAFVAERKTLKRFEWPRNVRDWARSQLAQDANTSENPP